jgi:Flp pilus assembly protein TadG
MFACIHKIWEDRRGNAFLMAAAALPMIVGAAGLASDTIQWVLWKRQLQRAADSAAIAGVYAKIAGQDVTTQVQNDVNKNNQTGITLYSSPTIGYPVDGANYTNAVAVGLQVQRVLSFSSMFMSATPVITANATAAGVEAGKYCVVSLENSAVTGITAGGSTSVDLGCGMITNSTSMNAAIAFGASSVTASPVAAVGGLSTGQNWASGTTLLPFTIAEQDPFAAVPAPAIPSPCNTALSDKPNGQTNASPGCYTSMTLKGTTTLAPGTYIITGSIQINATAKVSCTGCTIILTNSIPSSTGSITINGGAQLNLSAPTTGVYAGLLFYQNRNAAAGTNKLNGGSSSTFQGAAYFPNQDVTFTGSSGVTYNCLQLVARTVTFMGSSAVTNNCPANSGAGAFSGRHVRLVA